MKKLFYIILLAAFVSCQIEDDNAPRAEDTFIKYFGESADQNAADLEPIYNADSSDVENFVILGTQEFEGEGADYYVAISDAFGNLLNTTDTITIRVPLFGEFNQNPGIDTLRFEGDEVASQIEILPGGGYALVGTTTMNQSVIDIIDLQLITIVFLDNDLNVIGTKIIRTSSNDLDIIGNDIIFLSDNTFLVVGAIDNGIDFDFYAAKFGILPDTTYWERIIDLAGDDVFVRAFEKADGNLDLFGYSEDFGIVGEQGTNVTYVELNANGVVINGNSNGINDQGAFLFDDVLTDVIEKPGGYMAVGTSTVNEETFGFFMDIDNRGIAVQKDTLISEFTDDGGASLQSQAFGVTASATNDFIIVGQYPSFRTGQNSRDGEANRGAESMFIRIDQVGEEVAGFENHFGIGDGNDLAVDAIELPDGKIVTLNTIDFGGSIKMISLIKLYDTGRLDR